MLDHNSSSIVDPSEPADSSVASDDAQEEFWRLWAAEGEHLRALCQRWLQGGGSDVEELMSVAALKAVEYLRARPHSVRDMVPWISRILYHLCIDRLRERARVISLDDGRPDANHGSPILRRVVETPEQRVQRSELGRSLTRAVHTLPPNLRAVFMLRFVDELSYQEISMRLHISPQSVRKRIQRARLRLREDLRLRPPHRG